MLTAVVRPDNSLELRFLAPRMVEFFGAKAPLIGKLGPGHPTAEILLCGFKCIMHAQGAKSRRESFDISDGVQKLQDSIDDLLK